MNTKNIVIACLILLLICIVVYKEYKIEYEIKENYTTSSKIKVVGNYVKGETFAILFNINQTSTQSFESNYTRLFNIDGFNKPVLFGIEKQTDGKFKFFIQKNWISNQYVNYKTFTNVDVVNGNYVFICNNKEKQFELHKDWHIEKNSSTLHYHLKTPSSIISYDLLQKYMNTSGEEIVVTSDPLLEQETTNDTKSITDYSKIYSIFENVSPFNILSIDSCIPLYGSKMYRQVPLNINESLKTRLILGGLSERAIIDKNDKNKDNAILDTDVGYWFKISYYVPPGAETILKTYSSYKASNYKSVNYNIFLLRNSNPNYALDDTNSMTIGNNEKTFASYQINTDNHKSIITQANIQNLYKTTIKNNDGSFSNEFIVYGGKMLIQGVGHRTAYTLISKEGKLDAYNLVEETPTFQGKYNICRIFDNTVNAMMSVEIIDSEGIKTDTTKGLLKDDEWATWESVTNPDDNKLNNINYSDFIKRPEYIKYFPESTSNDYSTVEKPLTALKDHSIVLDTTIMCDGKNIEYTYKDVIGTGPIELIKSYEQVCTSFGGNMSGTFCIKQEPCELDTTTNTVKTCTLIGDSWTKIQDCTASSPIEKYEWSVKPESNLGFCQDKITNSTISPPGEGFTITYDDDSKKFKAEKACEIINCSFKEPTGCDSSDTSIYTILTNANEYGKSCNDTCTELGGTLSGVECSKPCDAVDAVFSNTWTKLFECGVSGSTKEKAYVELTTKPYGSGKTAETVCSSYVDKTYQYTLDNTATPIRCIREKTCTTTNAPQVAASSTGTTGNMPTPPPPNSSTSSDDSSESSSSNNTGAIVGGTLGGVVGLAVVVGIGVWLWKRRGKKINYSESEESES